MASSCPLQRSQTLSLVRWSVLVAASSAPALEHSECPQVHCPAQSLKSQDRVKHVLTPRAWLWSPAIYFSAFPLCSCCPCHSKAAAGTEQAAVWAGKRLQDAIPLLLRSGKAWGSSTYISKPVPRDLFFSLRPPTT